MFSISTLDTSGEAFALAAGRGLELELSDFAGWANAGRRDLAAEAALRLAAARGPGAAKFPAGFRSVHGPFMDLMPATVDPELRAVAFSRFRWAIEACASLGSPKLVLHAGWMPKTYGDEAWLKNSLAFWRSILAFIDDGPCPGLRIHLENVYEDDWRLLSELVDAVADERLSLCLDLGHVNANSAYGAVEWIEALGFRIGHIHLHNNHGARDEHNGLADGTLDMEAVLRALAEHCPEASWNIESKKDVVSSIDYLLDFYRREALGRDFG
jgi:sugar phosphate isomerase/epimerase